MSDVSIGIAASSRDWSLGLHRFVADHGGARVRVRVMHPEDAFDEAYDVLVIDDITSFLSAHFVREVQRRDRKVLGVFEETAGERRLHSLGVDAVISTVATPEQFIATIVDLAASREVDEEFAELVAGLDEGDDSPAAPDKGRLLVVGGAGGGVGATEIAVAIAGELADRRLRVVLVDADDVSPNVAQRLAMTLHPNIRTAMDRLQHHSGNVSEALVPHPSGFFVLLGLPNVRDWAEIRSGDAVDVIDTLVDSADVVVVNVSPMVEESMAGSRGEGRFGVTRHLISLADDVALVAGQSPTAIVRTINWVADTHSLLGQASLHLVVNRFQEGVFVRGEIEQEMHDLVRPSSVTFVPYDPKIARAAWEGTRVAKSGFRKAVATVVDRVLPVATKQRTGS
jgi:MinD-like ATPase involved in chromosome partitioning or flagellar assembly